MNKRALVAALGALGVGVGVLATTVTPAGAHGWQDSPFKSRQAICNQEGGYNSPDAETSGIKDPACRAAFAEIMKNRGGGADGRAAAALAFGQPQSVLVADSYVDGVGGMHRTRIPDGKLASAGNGGGADFSGFDLPRGDWQRSTVTSGAEVEVGYHATAHHAGGHIELYVTKDGVDLSKPLKWDDLEPVPFAYVNDPDLSNATPTKNPGVMSGDYRFKVTLPEKQGDHVIYTIWQRHKNADGTGGSGETFYSASDVTFTK
ncbi:lytic polysaccharide monooxygenase [Streptomyces sp. NPDC026092]|uniref:lytic polysaccharide monooxygenase auxiliary activity family 9 protein n=1 Tax=Streptomyces sp. NPDC026092 TaxID=3154797 RepID=UPI00340DCDED